MILPNPFYAMGAFYRAVKRLFSVKPSFVTEEEAQKRLDTCDECPYFDQTSRQCRICTCFVDLKVQLSTEDCPKGRWP